MFRTMRVSLLYSTHDRLLVIRLSTSRIPNMYYVCVCVCVCECVCVCVCLFVVALASLVPTAAAASVVASAATEASAAVATSIHSDADSRFCPVLRGGAHIYRRSTRRFGQFKGTIGREKAHYRP